jgi:hypothetical protein
MLRSRSTCCINGCYVLLHRYRGVLRRRMQHCGVEVVANAEEFGGVDTVVRIEGETAGLHGPLDGGTGDIAGPCRLAEGELGHGWALRAEHWALPRPQIGHECAPSAVHSEVEAFEDNGAEQDRLSHDDRTDLKGPP